MKVAQLKVELAARGSTRTGLKATLQRRLHALIVQAAIERRRADAMDDPVGWDEAVAGGWLGASAREDNASGFPLLRPRARRTLHSLTVLPRKTISWQTTKNVEYAQAPR